MGVEMVKVGLLVQVEAKPDRVDEVVAMLKAAAAQVQQEESAPAWFALRLGATSIAVTSDMS
jgi:quinol monooxygenase YgiN